MLYLIKCPRCCVIHTSGLAPTRHQSGAGRAIEDVANSCVVENGRNTQPLDLSVSESNEDATARSNAIGKRDIPCRVSDKYLC